MQTLFVQERIQGRGLQIYLPEGYENSGQHYAVVYVQDSGDLIDPKESESLQAIRALSRDGALPELIFVGIESFDRNEEYTPFVATNVFEPDRLFGGKAATYAQFLATTLKPYIDSKFRTRPEPCNTGIIGFSLGGLISFYTGILYPDVFGRIGSFSGSFWFPGIVDWVQQRTLKDWGSECT